MIKNPKCPRCEKVQADYLEGWVQFTCPRCKFTFTLDSKLDKVEAKVYSKS